MKKSIIITAVLMPLIVTAAFCWYNGCILNWNLLWAAIPAILTALAIPVAQKAIKSGVECYVWSYIFMIFMPLVLVGTCSMVGIMPLTTIMVFLTLPTAIGCSRNMYNSLEGSTPVFSDLPTRTATFHNIFCTLLTLAFLLGRFI